MWFDGSAPAVPMMPHRPFTVGLVNNASDGAFKAVERQFVGLIRSASNALDLRLELFTCPEVRRTAPPASASGESYSDVASLFDTRLDALIVTGMEPQAARLEDEPVFERIAEIAAWAEAHAVPVIWSCLAAHAAVLSLDGITREKLAGKLAGVFEFDVVSSQHPLVRGLPSRLASPHSRHNGLSEAVLRARGYQVLSRSDEAGVDMFVKQGNANFVFCHGHPEYGADTLLLEYCRDVRRWLAGKRADYPAMPEHYFDSATIAAFEAMRQQAQTQPQGMAQPFEPPAMALACRWQASAARLYANWIGQIVQDNAHPAPLQPVAAGRAAVLVGQALL